MPALSYTSFPDIVDTIIASSAFSTQLSLRLACSAFRNAVDRLHVRHLVLTPLGSESVAVKAIHHAIPALRSMTPASWIQQPPHELTSWTRVVDIQGFFPATCDLRLLSPDFPSLKMVRICTSGEEQAYTPYVPFAAETVVVFSSNSIGLPYHIDYNNRDGEDGPPPTAPEGAKKSISESVKTIIVNLKGEHADSVFHIAEVFFFLHEPPPHIEEIVIIVPRCRNINLAGTASTAELDTHVLMLDLGLLIAAPGVRYFVVGLEHVGPDYEMEFLGRLRSYVSQWRPEYLDRSSETPKAAARSPTSSASSQCSESRHGITKEEQVEAIVSRVQVLTVEEYVDRVGKAQAVLELVEYLGPTEFDEPISPDMLSPETRMAMAAFVGQQVDPNLNPLAAYTRFVDQLANPSPEINAAMADFRMQFAEPSLELALYVADLRQDLGLMAKSENGDYGSDEYDQVHAGEE